MLYLSLPGSEAGRDRAGSPLPPSARPSCVASRRDIIIAPLRSSSLYRGWVCAALILPGTVSVHVAGPVAASCALGDYITPIPPVSFKLVEADVDRENDAHHRQATGDAEIGERDGGD